MRVPALNRILRTVVGAIPTSLRSTRLSSNRGYCVICERDAVFVIHGPWLRDEYRCASCTSMPRNRALVNALNRFAKDWRSGRMHESSPGGPLSEFLKSRCPLYSSSQFFADVPRGASWNGHQSEDLSHLTFESDTFDVFVTSDVFEHVIDPANAFREIGRVLKPGGVHIFTMPWYPHQHTTVQRAGLTPGGDVEHYLEPVYHGNPIDAEGSLVIFDWGADFPQFIRRGSGMETMVYLERDRSKGLDAELMEVFVSTKPCA